MKPPRLTIAVRRGLKDVAQLAAADIDADSAERMPYFRGQQLYDIERALRWVASLDTTPNPPRKVTKK